MILLGLKHFLQNFADENFVVCFLVVKELIYPAAKETRKLVTFKSIEGRIESKRNAKICYS